MNAVNEHNRRAWDERVRRGEWHTETARARDFADPLASIDECGWLEGNVRGKRVLCLAAGGGKHGPLFAAAGAAVTVVDLSPAMLELDRRIATERGFNLRLVETSMEDLSALGDESFDVVIQPVSTCYVPSVVSVYREVARVLAVGGLYISQHKQPASLQADVLPSPKGYVLSEPYYRSGPLPPVVEGCLHREAGTTEFLHRWEELLGELCRAGFVLEDLVEPRHTRTLAEQTGFAHRSSFVPPFVTFKARRKAGSPALKDQPRLWTPR